MTENNGQLKQAIEVLKKFKEWANTPTHGSSKYDLIKLFGAIDTVVNELEKPTYTAEDMEAFAEWCDKSLYAFHHKSRIWVSYGMGRRITTAQLRELWEVETGRKEAPE